MEIIVKRTYFKEDCTVGFLQVKLSGEYESEFLPNPNIPSFFESLRFVKASKLERGGAWEVATLEPHAIAWEDKPLIGQKSEPRIYGKTAIPEGTYRIELQDSKTYKRKMPVLLRVPTFKNVVLRTGKTAGQTRGDILVGKLAPVINGHPSDNPHLEDSRQTFNLLFSLIEEAIDYGEKVWLTVRSPKGWTFPSAEGTK